MPTSSKTLNKSERLPKIKDCNEDRLHTANEQLPPVQNWQQPKPAEMPPSEILIDGGHYQIIKEASSLANTSAISALMGHASGIRYHIHSWKI